MYDLSLFIVHLFSGLTYGQFWRMFPVHLCKVWNLSLHRSHGALAARFSRVTSHCWVGHFHALIAWGDHWDTFLSAGDSQNPMAGRLRVGSGTSREPLSDSPFGYILRIWKIEPSKRPGPNTNSVQFSHSVVSNSL